MGAQRRSGQGSVFTLWLPLVLRAAGEASDLAETPQVLLHDLSGVRVLVVDDEATVREVMYRVLHEAGAQVALASSAAEALALLSGPAAQDVLVPDISMPEVDGYQLARMACQLDGSRATRLPKIALTAHALSEDRERALSAGFDAHLSKPIRPYDLLATVQRLARPAEDATT